MHNQTVFVTLEELVPKSHNYRYIKKVLHEEFISSVVGDLTKATGRKWFWNSTVVLLSALTIYGGFIRS